MGFDAYATFLTRRPGMPLYVDVALRISCDLFLFRSSALARRRAAFYTLGPRR